MSYLTTLFAAVPVTLFGLLFADGSTAGTTAADCCAQNLACCQQGAPCCAESKPACCEQARQCCEEQKACCGSEGNVSSARRGGHSGDYAQGAARAESAGDAARVSSAAAL